ncbi:5-formyltetrahydrofolate cyclo-ligase [Mangrovactinospora gilvigrisea]|uniref:5-formyltetrahydrofolate cyclo-ligase n=1 Tax=Mangrovactinospora gilvigrisea TaxID=1428644 RepID=A0A1J7BT72_9ACTN|nr:5-formyltetrahydrofolate cyclo-ligase [Mangrovactinospora gilvigrisea]OIV36665.1 5-formyltetrahydrofolate cyclo-ligase [Mangrovactinospora gilvigrisea]
MSSIAPDLPNEKRALRSRILGARRARDVRERGDAARELAARGVAAARGHAVVAAYVSMGTEPGTRPLLEGLRGAGVRVLLPVLRPDLDLDWGVYTGAEALAPAARGLLEPTGARLGADAVRGASLVLLPGLAVGADGTRLGRGGGSYDRVLARLAGTPAELAVLLYDDEVLEKVPAEPHDERVDAAITPSGLHRFPR